MINRKKHNATQISVHFFGLLNYQIIVPLYASDSLNEFK